MQGEIGFALPPGMSDPPITSPDYWRDLADETRDKANRYASERERFLRVAEETKDSLSVLRSGSAMRRWSGQRVTELAQHGEQ